MMHEEVPTEPGTTCHGIQMFAKLPAEKELFPPVAFHEDSPPEVVLEDGVSRVRVLSAKGTISISATPDKSSFILVLNGAVETPDGTVIGPDTGAAFAMDGAIDGMLQWRLRRCPVLVLFWNAYPRTDAGKWAFYDIDSRPFVAS